MLAPRRYARFLKYASLYGIMCGQECHGQIADINELSRELRGYQIGHSLIPHNPNAGGVITCLSPKLLRAFHHVSHHTIVEGRIIMSMLSGRSGSLCIIDVHMPNTNEQIGTYRRALSSLCERLPPAASCHAIVLGDWNFALSAEGRLRADGT
eukprot:5403739-Pyramimonas_sp.AAC.1